MVLLGGILVFHRNIMDFMHNKTNPCWWELVACSCEPKDVGVRACWGASPHLLIRTIMFILEAMIFILKAIVVAAQNHRCLIRIHYVPTMQYFLSNLPETTLVQPKANMVLLTAIMPRLKVIMF